MKHLLLLLHEFSQCKHIQKTCYNLIDMFFVIEYQLHNSCVEALRCLMWNEKEDSFISAWINDVYERRQFFSKVKRFLYKIIRNVFGMILCKSETAIYHGKNVIDLIVAFLRVSLFYVDHFKDIWLIVTLYHIDSEILGLKAYVERYSSVGGINYTYLVLYMAAITMISEIWIYCHVCKKMRNGDITSNYRPSKTIFSWMIQIFPIHFMIFELAYLELK